MHMLALLCTRTSRCFIRQPCLTTGLGFASWLLRGPPMKRPCSGAQLSRFSMFYLSQQTCLMPCRQASLPSAWCRVWTWDVFVAGRVGADTSSRSLAPVLVAPRTSPSDAREQYHGDATTLSGIQVLGLSSRLWPTDILPDHANRLVQHVRHQQHAWLYGCCSVPLRRAWRSCPHLVPRVVARRPCAAAGVTAPFVWTPWQDAHAVAYGRRVPLGQGGGLRDFAL